MWIVAAILVAVAAFELFVKRTPDATFLVALTFFTMIVQGCVALAATGVLTKALWIAPVRESLLAVHPLILAAALLSPLLAADMDIYRWTDHTTRWLDPRFFAVRNFLVLIAVFFAARKLSSAVRRGATGKSRWAGIYIALFIVSQSLVAFDWIMSLEYPWVSTLLGGFFFVESFLMGLSVAVFIVAFRMRSPGHGLTETLADASKMMFGFSIMWVGFFFAQFLVIWYGNVPEEVGPVLERVGRGPYAGLSHAVIVLVWVAPFVILLSGALKRMATVMSGVATLILSGLFIEKLVLVLPVAGVNPAALAAETALLVAAVAILASGTELVTSQGVATAGDEPSSAG